ncbi:MAG: ABC transporter permease [bacterium]
MLKSFFKIAVRNLRKHKAHSSLNLTGLSIGMACCLLIFLYVVDELSYDTFNKKASRIYRVATASRFGDTETASALTPAPLAMALVQDFPEVQTATRLFTLFGEATISHGENRFNENRVFFADSTFFEVFNIPLIRGNPKAALTQRASIVLTEAAAQKYFGEEDPLGKTLMLNTNIGLKVTGVSANVPHNAHFHFDFLISLASFGASRNPSFTSQFNYHSYIVLQEGIPPERLEAQFPEAIKKYIGAQLPAGAGPAAPGGQFRWWLQPLTDIHLHSHLAYEIEPNGNEIYVYIFSAIAVMILLIACINFMNLATARAASRFREIGVRKVLGSNRSQLVRQFLSEAILMSGMASLLALVLVELCVPSFNRLTGKHIDAEFFGNVPLVLILAGLALLVGVLAGSYPAFLMSAFRPVAALKGKLSASKSAFGIRGGLVVFQFVISISLIVGTLVVQQQLQYLQDKNLGFAKEQVLVLRKAYALIGKYETFKQELLQNPSVLSAAISHTIPGELFGLNGYRFENDPPEKSYSMNVLYADYDFVKTMGMEVIAGRDFSREFATDTSAVLLNEAAVRLLGWSDPVGKQLLLPGNKTWRGAVVGVVKDFHFASLHQEIRPLVIHNAAYAQYLSLRIRSENIPATLAFIASQWRAFAPEQPLDYSFLDENFNGLYQAEQRTGKIAGAFAVLSVFIAVLGLFSLASFAAEQRTKEIGIRKVLGASVAGIVRLLSSEFVKLVLAANAIAWPIAFYVMNKWLQSFAYRVDIEWRVFVLAGGMAWLIALLTVSTQAIKAARANPVESLRYE